MESDSTIPQSSRQGPPLPDTDLARAAGSNFSSDISLEPGSTGYVESLVRLQAQAAGDDLFLDLASAAEDRLDAAEPPELTIVPESSGLVLPPVTAGSIRSARAAAFARCDLGGDHAPRNRLAASQIPEPRRGPDDHAEPAAANIPAIDADIDTGQFIAAQPPQVLVMHDASHGSQVGSCPRESPCGNQYLSRGQDAHHSSMSTCGAR